MSNPAPTRFHLVAPDLPGFGFTEVPADRRYRYSFENLSRTKDTRKRGSRARLPRV